MSGALAALLGRGSAAGAAPLDLSYLFSTLSTTKSHTISSSAQAGDLAILFCSAVWGSGATFWAGDTAGFTEIRAAQSGASLVHARGLVGYKVLTSGDIGATLTNLVYAANAGSAYSGILYFRPSKPISSVTDVSTGGNQGTTAAPTGQTIGVSTDNDPAYVAFASYLSNTNPTRGSGVTMTETTIANITGHRHYSKHKIYNVGNTLNNISITMTDGGNNVLQSGALKVH